MAIETVPRDFSDARVFVVGVNDPRIHSVHGLDHLGYEQDCDGPSYVVVGPDVSDEKLLRNLPALAARHGVTLTQLQAMRDTQMEVLQ
jgi:hypothetical protein